MRCDCCNGPDNSFHIGKQKLCKHCYFKMTADSRATRCLGYIPKRLENNLGFGASMKNNTVIEEEWQ